MADRTDQFNPYLPQRDAPDFTGASRGADPVRYGKSSTEFAAGMLKGVGDIFGAVVEGADSLIKENIEDEARTEVELNRDEFTQGLDREFGIGDRTTPPEMRQELEKTQQLTQARQHGRMSEVYYWAQMDAITRRLKNRYPGHKDYVEQYVSGLVGGTPANQVKAALQSALKNDSEDTVEKKISRLETGDDGAILPLVFPGYREKLEAGEDPERIYRTMLRRVNEFKSEQLKVKVEKENISLQGDFGVRDSTAARRLATKEMFNMRSLFIQGPNDAVVGFDAADTLQRHRALVEKQELGIATKEEELQALAFAREVKREYMTRAAAKLQDPAYKDLTPEDRKALLDDADKFMTYYLDSFTNKDHGTVYHNARVLDAIKIDGQLDFLEDENIQLLAGGKAVLGDLLNEALYGNDIARDAIAHSLSARMKLSGFRPDDPKSFKAIAEDSAKYTQNPAAFNDATEWLSAQLADMNKLTPEGRVQLVEYVFGKDNDKVFELLKEKDTKAQSDPYYSQRLLFQRFANDLTSKEILKLREANPQTWETYKKWVSSGAVTLFKQELDTAKEVMVNSQDTTIVVDPSTGFIKAVPVEQTTQPISPDMGKRSWIVDRYEANIRNPQIDRTVEKLNTVLNGVISVAKAEGQDPFQASVNMMSLFGIGKTGQPVVTKTGNAWGSLVTKINEAIGGKQQ